MTDADAADSGSAPAARDHADQARKRRAADLARVVPVAGVAALLLPVLWPADGTVATSVATGYVFAAWAGMIAAAVGLGALLSRAAPEPPSDRVAGARSAEVGDGPASGASR